MGRLQRSYTIRRLQPRLVAVEVRRWSNVTLLMSRRQAAKPVSAMALIGKTTTLVAASITAHTILPRTFMSLTSSSLAPIYLRCLFTLLIHICFDVPLLLHPGSAVCSVCLRTWSSFHVPLRDVQCLQPLPDIFITHNIMRS